MQLFAKMEAVFRLSNKYIPKLENKLAHAMFSNEGPYLSNPEVTSNPKVIPNR